MRILRTAPVEIVDATADLVFSAAAWSTGIPSLRGRSWIGLPRSGVRKPCRGRDRYLSEPEADYEYYRRSAEVLERLGERKLLGDLVKRAQQFPDDEDIQEVVEDYRDYLDYPDLFEAGDSEGRSRARKLLLGFDYPPQFRRLVREGLVDLKPWHVLLDNALIVRRNGLRRRYPSRHLMPFAERQDSEDVACWDLDASDVVIVHDHSVPGSEQRRRFPDFTAWLRQAFEDYIDFEP